MNNDLLYQVALTLLPDIGTVQARNLIDQVGDARTIFKLKGQQLRKLEGMGEIRVRSVLSFNDFSNAEEEIKFIEKSGIRPLFLTDKEYPQRLLNCYDAPTLLYQQGNTPLNVSKVVAIVGTRHHSEYGRQLTEKLVEELHGLDILIVSGLAYGIDALAHKASIRNELNTVAVLAHGLDQVYPAAHRGLAKEMIAAGGGLLSEFRHGIIPDRHHFPSRNRIVAGMSDVTVVVETGIKGGSIITAELANGYNRDVVAFPGRTSDIKCEGNHHLIRNNKASLITRASDLLELMGWAERDREVRTIQQSLFVELNEEERRILEIIREKELTAIDELNLRSGLSSSKVAGAILTLELKNVIVSLPGKLYRML